ncbi:hypothetical protein N7470_006538 [Penicillium chermesinum]|nr:hypothetical protein N7470_006538 [Penicillium chermesinum]
MVSFWPWKGEDNSPASFEKTLSTLSTKITQSTARLDQQRQTSRRFKALWTLYSIFAYILYSIILALVLGWESWSIKEYAAVTGGPVLIYLVRSLGGRFFDYRISRSQKGLDDLQKQRDETIEKLKVATKYNSTQQLLEKYGGGSPEQSPSPKPKSQDAQSKPPNRQQPPVGRTGLPPPPTANIVRNPVQPPRPEIYDAPPSPNPPSQQQPSSNPPPSPPSPQTLVDEPGFAPNAFSTGAQYIEQPHWYDRLLDVLLGEDEMQPRNRMAMICSSCRLVNGQAPPGIKTPEELGRWRCGSCGAWNGEESEATQILSSLRQNPGRPEGTWESQAHAETSPEQHVRDEAADAATEEVKVEPESDPETGEADEAKQEPVRRSARGKAAQ